MHMYQNTFLDTAGGQRLVDAIFSIAKNLQRIADKVDGEVSLSGNQKEAIYREVELGYLKEDALIHLADFNGNSDGFSDEQKSELFSRYGENILDVLAQEFMDQQDCNIPDNITWECLIRNYFAELGIKPGYLFK